MQNLYSGSIDAVLSTDTGALWVRHGYAGHVQVYLIIIGDCTTEVHKEEPSIGVFPPFFHVLIV